MKIYKFADLILYENKLKQLCEKYGISYNRGNRVAAYFRYLRKIEEARQTSGDCLSKLIEKDKAKYYFSQYYVLEICNIVEAIEGNNQNQKIVKEKLTDLLKGTYLLSEESSNNTKARDTTFELTLFSFLHNKILNVRLCDPNPDLKIFTDNFTYHVECKRPQSAKTLEKHIRNGMNQLKNLTHENIVPAVALSLEQIIFDKNDLILSALNASDALRFLDKSLEVFLQKNLPTIQKIFKEQPCLIIYYLSCLVGFKETSPMSNATFITGNIYNFEKCKSIAVYKDLNTLLTKV